MSVDERVADDREGREGLPLEDEAERKEIVSVQDFLEACPWALELTSELDEQFKKGCLRECEFFAFFGRVEADAARHDYDAYNFQLNTNFRTMEVTVQISFRRRHLFLNYMFELLKPASDVTKYRPIKADVSISS